MNKNIPESLLNEVTRAFLLSGNPSSVTRFGNGHINDTFLVDCGKKYILQRINTDVFQNPLALMENIENVTAYLKRKIIADGGDPGRETLNLIPAKDSRFFYVDGQGSYWRTYAFIDHATAYDTVRNAGDFYQSGRAFGNFQRLLSGYPSETLFETIPGFHDTPARYKQFLKALQEDPCRRACGVQKEIDFVMKRASDMDLATGMVRNGTLPLRVTHNDTKLNNIMLDDTTGEAVCIIDLDTIMPGLSINDFGDSIRFGANTAKEDEPDLSRVSLSVPLYETFCRGFMEGCRGSLQKAETDMLPQGARLMTLECGMRFLADYLEGDHYFRISRPGQNLDRARTQFALIDDMERKWDQLDAVTKRFC
jgi:hypothetical protein